MQRRRRVLQPLRVGRQRSSARSVRSPIGPFLALGATLALFALALSQPPTVVAAVALLICLGSAAVISRAPMGAIGVVLIVLFSFTASWDNASIGGVKPRMLFLLLGLVLLIAGFGVTHVPHVPWWIHAYALAGVAVTIVQVLFPVSDSYLSGRYETSAAGQSLLIRPGALPSLLSLLLNSYAVPMAVLLACMFNPKALRWIIVAYVSGAALSNLAAFLGYEGNDVLLTLVVAPIPAQTRALGYTSHPLHLATSGVMALALACWVAVQRQLLLKWTGRLSIIALLLGLYASGSRGGNAAALFALALSVFLLPEVRRRLHMVGAVTAVAFAATIIYLPSVGKLILQTTRLYGGLTNDVSDAGRSEVLDQGISDFHHSPIFGIGVRYIAEAHILYAGVLASGGLILFAAYVAFNAGSLHAAVVARRFNRTLGGALIAALLTSLVYWTVADDFQVASVQLVYGFLLAAPFYRTSEDADDSVEDHDGQDAGARPHAVASSHRTDTLAEGRGASHRANQMRAGA